jgi:hypothetical protein
MAKTLSKAARDNRSKQLDSTNTAYWRSRGYEQSEALILARAEQLRDNPPQPAAGDKPTGTSDSSTKHSAKSE